MKMLAARAKRMRKHACVLIKQKRRQKKKKNSGRQRTPMRERDQMCARLQLFRDMRARRQVCWGQWLTYNLKICILCNVILGNRKVQGPGLSLRFKSGIGRGHSKMPVFDYVKYCILVIKNVKA